MMFECCWPIKIINISFSRVFFRERKTNREIKSCVKTYTHPTSVWWRWGGLGSGHFITGRWSTTSFILLVRSQTITRFMITRFERLQTFAVIFTPVKKNYYRTYIHKKNRVKNRSYFWKILWLLSMDCREFYHF